MRYVDVFVSHKLEDKQKAERLAALIGSWGFECYLDANDAELDKFYVDTKGRKQQTVQDPAAMAAHIRDSLRTCRCFIYAYSSRSAQSKWMPWELGFFDGRWGRRHIGLYDLDEATVAGTPRHRDNSVRPDTLSLQEYLQMYEPVDRDGLEAFVRRCVSTRALADRADVEVDRIQALVAGALRNPPEFAAGCMQYTVSLYREAWSTLVPLPALAPLAALEQAFGATMPAGSRRRSTCTPRQTSPLVPVSR
jgi:hypothetical protein